MFLKVPSHCVTRLSLEWHAGNIKHYNVCSKLFEDDDFKFVLSGTRRLKDIIGACPSVFMVKTENRAVFSSQESTSRERKEKQLRKEKGVVRGKVSRGIQKCRSGVYPQSVIECAEIKMYYP